MAHINWDQSYFYNPERDASSPPSPEPPGEGYYLIVPYGNYGGPDFYLGALQPEVGGPALPTGELGRPLSYKELKKLGGDVRAEDRLDYQFYLHDLATAQAQDPQDQVEADAALLAALVDLNVRNDPEASLYAGVATLAMVWRLADPVVSEPSLLPLMITALEDAATNIERGLRKLPQEELATALELYFEPAAEDVFTFDFTVAAEAGPAVLAAPILLYALNEALDGGEEGDVPLLPAIGEPGTTYQLAYNIATNDLDLAAVVPTI